jgi:hypothetical protein
MANKCYPMVRGRRFRITRLDACGNPVLGPDSQIVSDGVVTLGLTANIEEGEEINVTNANGDVCVLDTPCPKFQNYGVEISFCRVNPSLLAMMSGQEVFVNDGDIVGFSMDSEISACDAAYALEAWTGVPSDACDPGSGVAYGYILLPFIRPGVLGDFSVENAAINFTITGSQTKKGPQWGVGPYDVIVTEGVPSPLPEPLTVGKHLVTFQTTLAPPAADCEPQELGTLATGADEVAGTQGDWTPANSYGPEDLAELTSSGIVADPATAWDTGSYMLLRDGSHAHWDSAAWVAGDAP